MTSTVARYQYASKERIGYRKTLTETTDHKGDEEPGTCSEQLPAVKDSDDSEDEAGDDSSCFGRCVFIERVLCHVYGDGSKPSVSKQLEKSTRVCNGVKWKTWAEVDREP